MIHLCITVEDTVPCGACSGTGCAGCEGTGIVWIDRPMLVRAEVAPATRGVGATLTSCGVAPEGPCVEALDVSCDGGRTWCSPEDAGLPMAEVKRIEERLIEQECERARGY